MKVEELEVGGVYECVLSGKDMLVVMVDKPIGSGEETEKVFGGKYYEEINGQSVFKVEELFDGQLKEKE